MGMEVDDPRRFRRQTPSQKQSLNAPRSAEGMLKSFGPGKPGCFGEGGNHASAMGPLSDKPFEVRTYAYRGNYIQYTGGLK